MNASPRRYQGRFARPVSGDIGIGEAFIYAGGARDIAARMNYGAQSLEHAGSALLNSVAHHKGDGGLIAIDKHGHVIMPFNSPGMKRACAGSDVDLLVEIL